MVKIAVKPSVASQTTSLKCAGCGLTVANKENIIYCPHCGKDALLVSEVINPRNNSGDQGLFSSYSAWLPYELDPILPDPSFGCVQSKELGEKLGLQDLWVSISGYSPCHGALLETGSFKECEAIGVLSRVKQQSEKTLIISSAGSAARAFLQIGSLSNSPLIVVAPERAASNLKIVGGVSSCKPLLILIRDSFYPDAIRFVDEAVAQLGNKLVREGGCYNVARRDSMGIPFLRAVHAMNGLPDIYVQAVGSGTGAIAAWEAAQRLVATGMVLARKMRLFLIQNTPFTPIADAWIAGKEFIEPLSDEDVRHRLSAVDAQVLSNINPPYSVKGGVYDVLKKSDGEACRVENSEVRAARELAEKTLSFRPCPAGSVALAGLIKKVRQGKVEPGKRVLLHFTGGGHDQIERSLMPDPYPRCVIIDQRGWADGVRAIREYLDNEVHQDFY